MMHKPLLNSGIIFAPPPIMMMISQLILDGTVNGVRCKELTPENHFTDQSIFGNIANSGLIPHRIIVNASSTLHSSIIEQTRSNNRHPSMKLGEMKNSQGSYYVIVHQYDRSDLFKESFRKACSPIFSPEYSYFNDLR